MEKNLEYRVSWWDKDYQEECFSIHQTKEEAERAYEALKVVEANLKASNHISLPKISYRLCGKWKEI